MNYIYSQNLSTDSFIQCSLQPTFKCHPARLYLLPWSLPSTYFSCRLPLYCLLLLFMFTCIVSYLCIHRHTHIQARAPLLGFPVFFPPIVFCKSKLLLKSLHEEIWFFTRFQIHYGVGLLKVNWLPNPDFALRGHPNLLLTSTSKMCSISNYSVLRCGARACLHN